MPATTPPNAAPNTGSTEDALGYDAYAKTLWARIEQGLNRDTITSKLGDDPLVVGIFGEWGAGKSFLLDSIHGLSIARLAEQKALQNNDPGVTLTIPVWFQAWKYEHEAHLHVPLLLHVMNALKDAFREPPSIAGQLVEVGTKAVMVAETIAKPTGKLLKAANAVFPIVQKVIGSISVFGVSLNIPDEIGDWLETAADAAEGAEGDEKDDAADKKNKAEKERKDAKSHVATATQDGLYFYRIHELLAALTRPGKYEGRKDLFDGAKVTKETRINFVVFVDDLDRCLPEKAVAVLELIKTVFNVESFAFVLALDDEVIERGIGHRYRDYALGNKKSEMPITGFEYLEKIVHLPFRLPALTRDDALLFIRQKELKLRDSMTPEQLSEYGNSLWISGFRVKREATRGEKDVSVLDLSHILVNSFDAYVPRKLDRAIELFHHVSKVATERGRPLSIHRGTPDIRIIFALVLIQLFQPDLFRCLRRTGTGFDQLRDSFSVGALSSQSSDYELLDWACFGPELHLLKLQENEASARDPLPVSLAAASLQIANLPASIRHSSQRVRLPIVERMLEHRAAQRHVFDPLKLFAALQASSAVVQLPDGATKSYFSWLALHPSTNESATLLVVDTVSARETTHTGEAEHKGKPPTQTGNVEGIGSAVLGALTGVATAITDTGRVRLTEVAGVFNVLTAFEPREQAEVVNRAGLQVGQVIDSSSASELLTLAERWLRESQSSPSLNVFGAKHVLLRGLQHLAPHLAQADAARFWSLVKDCVTLPTEPNALLDVEPRIAALYADVRAALGQDDRFTPDFPFIMTQRFGQHSVADEPIPGFVRVPEGGFTMGHVTEKGNQRRAVNIDAPFYIARTLTTVAQYALFVQKQRYQPDAAIWNKHGVEWLAKNPQQRSPARWSEQLAHPVHPVTNITWFEARAYAQWLITQLRETLDTASLQRYDVRLPTEPQWERAVRAENLSVAHRARWPWGDAISNIAQRANVSGFGIGSTSTVGVFAPNAIGLHDMAGNAWEWTNNRFDASKEQDFAHVPTVGAYEEIAENDVSLRGGSWFDDPELASCSYRFGGPPSYFGNGIGLRVVLSLVRSAKRET
jgi:formylglycine-generating enzyme required for sulfatase activity